MTRIIVLIGLFFASCALFFYNPFWSVTQEKPTPQQDSYLPDFTAKDMTLRRFDEQGALSSLVKAEKMEYYSDSVTTFSKPSYIIYPKDGSPRWKIDADNGIFDQQDRVILNENVIISSIDPTQSLKQIHTSYLEVNLATMQVTSDKKITIEGTQYNATGIGLKADLNLRQFELIKDIQATYETITP